VKGQEGKTISALSGVNMAVIKGILEKIDEQEQDQDQEIEELKRWVLQLIESK
jgi:hypothetical protein